MCQFLLPLFSYPLRLSFLTRSQNLFSHTSFISGSYDNRLYDVMISPVLGCITDAQKFWMFSWEWVSSIVFVMESWLSFVRGDIIFIPTADSENVIKASWLIILRVQTEGLGVPCSTCSIWNICFIPRGIVLESFLHCSCLLYIRH